MWADNETSEDLLGFKVHANLLIDVIKDDKVLPVTIGVFGDWGSGKSSILKILTEELDGGNGLKDDTLVLYFNGWVFEGYDDAKAALLEAIVKGFKEHRTLGSRVQNTATKLLKSVKWMRILGLSFKNVILPTAVAYGTGGLSLVPFLVNEFSKIDADDLAKQLKGKEAEKLLKSLIKESPPDENTIVREFREDFKEMIAESKIKKLVVIIDDLDRCTPERIIENLEAIKLFLNVERTAFVIGADPRIVRRAIEYRYKSHANKDDDSNDRIVEDYLEKLIQIPYNLPKLSDSEVETYISLLICQRELAPDEFSSILENFQNFRLTDRYSVYGLSSISETIKSDASNQLKKSLSAIPALVPLLTQILSGNPRQVKRFLNTLTLRQRLAEVAKISDFNDSILSKLMVLEYSELQSFRQLYEWQVLQKGKPQQISILEEVAKSSRSIEDFKKGLESMEDLKSWGKQRLFDWLRVEPLLHEADLSDYYWLSRDRIASVIPKSSLVPPVVKYVYKQLNQDALTDAISKKIIIENVVPFSEFEKLAFLDFCSQMLMANPKRKRCYDIFHSLMNAKIPDADTTYVGCLNSISPKEIPPAVGVALNNHSSIEIINKYIEQVRKSGTSFGNAAKVK